MALPAVRGAGEYRTRAAAMLRKAKGRLPAPTRRKLMQTASALLEQADNQDWLEGKPRNAEGQLLNVQRREGD
jgi:hypothetical protein